MLTRKAGIDPQRMNVTSTPASGMRKPDHMPHIELTPRGTFGAVLGLGIRGPRANTGHSEPVLDGAQLVSMQTREPFKALCAVGR